MSINSRNLSPRSNPEVRVIQTGEINVTRYKDNLGRNAQTYIGLYTQGNKIQVKHIRGGQDFKNKTGSVQENTQLIF